MSEDGPRYRAGAASPDAALLTPADQREMLDWLILDPLQRAAWAVGAEMAERLPAEGERLATLLDLVARRQDGTDGQAWRSVNRVAAMLFDQIRRGVWYEVEIRGKLRGRGQEQGEGEEAPK